MGRMRVDPPGLPVRPMAGRDLLAAARLHAQELPDGFFARLGTPFLQRYLATFLDLPGGVALSVDGDGGELVGFLVGSTRDGHHRAALRRHGPALLRAGALGLITRPALLLAFLRTRARRYAGLGFTALRRRRATVPARVPGPAPTRRRTAVLLHVVVAPSARGRGAGAALVRGLEVAARRDGCDRAVLVSFGDKPFYERLGWTRQSARRNAGGQDVVTYRRDL